MVITRGRVGLFCATFAVRIIHGWYQGLDFLTPNTQAGSYFLWSVVIALAVAMVALTPDRRKRVYSAAERNELIDSQISDSTNEQGTPNDRN